MSAKESKPLKTAAVVVAILFAIGVVCSATSVFFFGSSKVRPLFGMSADALAGKGEGSRQDPKLTKKPMRDLAPDAGY